MLDLAGVDRGAILDDYAQDDDALYARGASHGRHDDRVQVAALLDAHGTDARGAVARVLTNWDPVGYLTSAGVSDGDIVRLRERLAS